jgi:cytochrome c
MNRPILIALSAALLATSFASAQDSSSSAAASSSQAPASSSEVATAGDPTAGESVFNVCKACHAVGSGAANKVGPELNGLIGRPAGTAPGYRYSSQMKSSGLTWDEATFAKYIANPRGVVPGTKMTFAGIQDATKIADLTAYLASFNADGSKKQ